MLTKDFLQTIHAVPEDVLDQYLQHGSAFEAPRKTILTAPGETERYMYLVEKGIQKSYYLVGSKEHVIAFTYPPYKDLASYLRIDATNFSKLLNRIPIE